MIRIFAALLLAVSNFAAEEGFKPLFNGRDLSGWVNVNGAPETWTFTNGVVRCTGFPTGAMRTERQYENFILELEWRHLKSGGNSGVFLWGSPISAPGVPFLRGIEVQVLDHGYNANGKGQWYTTHGDVFPIHGATMKPHGRSNGQRSFPSEERSKPSPEWNHYRITATNGVVRLEVNGKEVSGGSDCNYRKGYLALESEGAPVEFRNVRMKELPSSSPAAEMVAPADEGFRAIFNHLDLRGWEQSEGWTVGGEKLRSTGASALKSTKSFSKPELIFDFKGEGEITVSGNTVKAEKKDGYQRFHLKGLPAGPISISGKGEFMNLFAKDSNDIKEGAKVLSPAELGVGRLVAAVKTNKKTKATVVAFTSTKCPVAQRYGPTLGEIAKSFGSRGVDFVFVNPVATESQAEFKAFAKKNGLKGELLRDAELAKTLGASSTTEVFVLDAARTLVYRGAIDDQYGLGYSRETARHNYLADALNATLKSARPQVAATSAPGCVLETAGAPLSESGEPTYFGRIARIVENHCAECHREGGVAPFDLRNYEELSSRAAMVAKQVEKGVMPPWFAAAGIGAHWANDRSLPEADKKDLVTWLKGSRKKGNPADAPLARVFPKDWALGIPDVVMRIPEPIAVKATGFMNYQNVYIDTGFTEDKWVSAIEVRPTARQVVHHVLVHVVAPGDEEKKTRADREGGNFFAAYVPGNNLLRFPEGFGKVIPAGSKLHFQIHYTPNGTATTDQTEVAMIFATEVPKHEIRVAAISSRLDIPPGEANYEARGRLPVMFDAKLMAFMPHMHVRGKSYRIEIERPNGERQTILDVPRYDFNWQLQYRATEPIDAPVGSVLIGTATYDNSANNPANPDPSARVKWGEQTYEEMMLGYFEFYVPTQEPGKRINLAELAVRDGGGVFVSLDKNRDGKITINESPSANQFKLADANGDGEVTREEFGVFWRSQRRRQ